MKFYLTFSIIFLLISCNSNRDCHRVIDQGYNPKDSTYYVTIKTCDTIKTYTLNRDIWVKYTQYQLDKSGSRIFNYSTERFICDSLVKP